jgi:hypothetical protein
MHHDRLSACGDNEEFHEKVRRRGGVGGVARLFV